MRRVVTGDVLRGRKCGILLDERSFLPKTILRVSICGWIMEVERIIFSQSCSVGVSLLADARWFILFSFSIQRCLTEESALKMILSFVYLYVYMGIYCKKKIYVSVFYFDVCSDLPIELYNWFSLTTLTQKWHELKNVFSSLKCMTVILLQLIVH